MYMYSIQVIPDMNNTSLVDMAEKMKEKDAKLHDANVSGVHVK